MHKEAEKTITEDLLRANVVPTILDEPHYKYRYSLKYAVQLNTASQGFTDTKAYHKASRVTMVTMA